MLRLTGLIAALVLAAPAAAQKEPAEPLSKEQIAQISALITDVDRRVAKGFEGDKELRPLLESELKRIASIKDPKARKAELSTFQAKHEGRYREVLARGGADLSALARQINLIAPWLNLRLVRGTYLAGTPATPTPTPTPAPTKTEKSLSEGDFSFTRDGSCRLFGGGAVTRSGLSVTNTVTAAELGGCGNSGELKHVVTISPDQRARVDARGTISGSVFALAIAGGSQATATSSIFARNLGGGLSVSCTALAVLAWGASESCEQENVAMMINVPSTNEFVARTSTRAFSAGVVSGTSATASARILEAGMTTEPR